MLTYRKANSVKVHVINNKLFTKLIGKKLSDLHINTCV